MDGPWEDLVLQEGVPPEVLRAAYERMLDEKKRVVDGILSGSIVLELMDDDDGY